MKPLKIACIGEAMVELSLDASHPDTARIGFAGDTLNTAVYLKRAAPLIEVSFVTRLGRDSFSKQMLQFIANEDIATDAITFSASRAPGLYAITTDEKGERTFAYWRDRSAARQLFQTDDGCSFAELEHFDVLYFSAITLAILPADVRAALSDWLEDWKRKTGGRVAFDSNYRPALWQDKAQAQQAISEFWKLCDIAIPSIDDEMQIFDDPSEKALLARFKSYGISDGALKRGESGPLSLSDTPGSGPYQAAQNVVDTTAAGDSFNGGYLGARLSGSNQPDALRAGHDLAAMVVGFKGAIAPQ